MPGDLTGLPFHSCIPELRFLGHPPPKKKPTPCYSGLLQSCLIVNKSLPPSTCRLSFALAKRTAVHMQRERLLCEEPEQICPYIMTRGGCVSGGHLIGHGWNEDAGTNQAIKIIAPC